MTKKNARLWVPPPFRRRAESTRAKYTREGRCRECGGGIYARPDKTLVWSPHHPNCPVLKFIVRREKAGWCGQCGTRKVRQKRWDNDAQMVVIREHCINGHGFGMTWRRPTKADRAELGLVKSLRP